MLLADDFYFRDAFVFRYLDMPVARQLTRYRGAVRIVRRAHDEIIHTSEDSSNRKVRHFSQGKDAL